MNSSRKIEPENHRKDIIAGALLFIAIVAIWYFSWILIDKYILSDTPSVSNAVVQGVFGDKFGAINALFSGLAFAGIIFTILLQKRELSLQREELQETREEFIQQNETLKKQRFENTFFQLLQLHIDIVDKLKITAVDGNTYENREFFIGAIKDLKYKSDYGYFKYSALIKLDASEISVFKSNRTLSHSFFQKLDKEEIKNLQALDNAQIEHFISEPITDKEIIIRKEYENFYHKVQYNLGHYFRNLYHIYKYVHTTTLIEEKEKQFYCNIVRAQLSTDELVLIFYNSLTPTQYFSETPNLGYPNFKYLIDKYDVLQNMNDRLLLDKAHMTIFNNNKISTEPEALKNRS
ncbi:putative phage abortive infection protein [Hymenobacter tenuis]